MPGNLPSILFPFQKDISAWAVRKGKAAIWAGTGLGKTLMQLSWAREIVKHTQKPVLILAPLAVSAQTKGEARKIDMDVSLDTSNGIFRITNYEQLHNIDCSVFSGIVLDESSILKNFAGKVKNQIIESFRETPYKLCCSATPSPNDFTEIGNHADFLNVCSRSEMLSTYFVHDSGSTQKWRLKGHAEKEFFKWLSTWAVMVDSPSDLGYDDTDFILPELKVFQHIVPSKKDDYLIFPELAKTLNERRQARRESLNERCEMAAALSKGSETPWIYWCDLNYESTTLSAMVENATEITGSQSNEIKEKRMIGFSSGSIQKIVTKPKIAMFGMNWQHCNNICFVGLSDSFEAYYQAVRRCWRFGQKKPVNVHIVISEKEGNVLQNIQNKEAKAKKMLKQMVSCMSELSKQEIQSTNDNRIEYNPQQPIKIPEWMAV